MSDKKHIDRLFQEGFKDFEATPDAAVWEQIEAQLNQKKKKRRVIPIWWRYAGVAALLLLFFTVGNIYFNASGGSKTNQVVDTQNTNSDLINSQNTNAHEPLHNKTTETNTAIADHNTQNHLKPSPKTESQIIAHQAPASQQIANAENNASKHKNNSKTTLTASDKLNIKKGINPSNNHAVAHTYQDQDKAATIQNTLVNNTQVAKPSENTTHTIGYKNESPLIHSEKEKTHITEASKNHTTVANANTKTDETIPSVKKPEGNKRSIEDALNEAKATIENPKNNLKNRWAVAPNVAPVYFNTLRDGSSIHPQFDSNTKSGDVNMSYGISTSYAINKKLRIRSGIHSVNLGYNTNDVVVFQSIATNTNSSGLQNISPISNVSILSSESISSDASSDFISSNATLNQNLRYVEVPLEIQYTLSDKKFGVNVIGGFSSFFLNQSKLFYEADNGDRRIIGEARNINNLSYSANVGLGLNYKVSKTFNFNLEPIFKYQFNTFNNTSGDFSPFFIGVYSGFAIKF